MTEQELKETIKQRFNEARNRGLFAQFALVAREMGVNLNAKYGPKYKWERDGVVLYLDDYGNYLTVSVNGSLACSTHITHMLIRPGDWQKTILDNYEEAHKRKAERDHQARQIKIDALTRLVQPI